MRHGTRWARRGMWTLTVLGVAVAVADQSLFQVPTPLENAPSEEKRVLGKMLFFEEQLSSDDSVACATCHVMTNGGTDPRRGRNPGSNALFGDLGDVMGSPGVVPMGENGQFLPAADFGTAVQVTGRTAPPPFAAIFQKEILWDGRAGASFVDADTGLVAVAVDGALESQALLPLTNSVEMGHAGRDLAQVVSKLAASRPLALASDLPPDMALALNGDPSYPELFRRAFGDTSITPVRIAMAIATYERTLVPDQTKYDRYAAGDRSALTQQEENGLLAMITSKCTICHVPPLFTDGTFRATGVRSPADDPGRANATLKFADRGKFKVPTLRNVALKTSFFHDGQRAALSQAIDFYDVIPGPAVDGVRPYGSPTGGQAAAVPSQQFVDNQDPLMAAIHFSSEDAVAIEAFLRGGLVDERVGSSSFPFDGPTLGSQRLTSRPILHDAARADASRPDIAIRSPAFAGNEDFTVSVVGGTEGAAARLLSWDTPSEDGRVEVSDPVLLTVANDVPFANLSFSLADARPGTTRHFAWRVEDSAAIAGARVTKTASVAITAARPKYSNGRPLTTPDVMVVDDGDAYVASARFSVDFGREAFAIAKDRFVCVASLGVPPEGTDLANGAISLAVGGVYLLTSSQMDADGRIGGTGIAGSFDRETGELRLSLKGLDLRAAIVTPASVPIRIEATGLGLATTVAATTLAFDAKPVASGPTTGRFIFRRTGTGNGAFRVTAVRAEIGEDGRVRVRLTAAIDAPESMSRYVPDVVTVSLGASPVARVAANVAPLTEDGRYSAKPAGDVRKLRLDLLKRSFILDATVDLPQLAAVAPGATVRLPVTLAMRSKETTATITFSTTMTVVSAAKR